MNSPQRTHVSGVIGPIKCLLLRRRESEGAGGAGKAGKAGKVLLALSALLASTTLRAFLAPPASPAPPAFTIVSVPQEIEIGREEHAQIRKQMAELRDPRVSRYIERIGKRLAAAAPGAKYPYSFTVANYREINAFSLPGGPVWINRGVLHAAGNESQVAGVLAHEIAHIAQRHAADQMTKAILAKWSLGMLGAMLGNAGGAGTAQVAGAVVADGVFLKFSRDDEEEADRVGLQIMTRAGWDARGMIELFEVLRREAKRDPSGVDVFLSSHPSPQNRIAQLQAATAHSHGGTRDTKEFRAVKAHVLQLPPPQKR